MRLNDDEWEELAQICSHTGKTVSQYMREALTHMESHSQEQIGGGNSVGL
jgi:predicted DNA-binding protein